MLSRSRTRQWAIGFCLTFLVACRDDGLTTPNSGSGAEPPSQNSEMRFEAARSIDDQFVALAGEIPGFGGFFFDETGNMVIVLTDPARRGAAVDVLARRYHSRRFSLPGGRRADIGAAKVRLGRFGFRELVAFRDSSRDALFAIPGMTFLDIHERANRVRVGARDAAAEQEIRATLRRLGIPEPAVAIERIPEFEFHQKLTDPFAVLVGGIQVSTGNGNICTHGPVAMIHDGNGLFTPGFVTNSHCTRYMGDSPMYQFVPNPSIFYQSWTFDRRIGIEVYDPPFWGGQNVSNPYGLSPTCPVGQRCRNSDAALIRYDAGVSFGQGRVARTAVNDSVIIGAPFRMINELSYGGYEGELMTKVGRTTGRTQGAQTAATCVDLPTGRATTAGYPITLLCQSAYEAASGTGDSGSPVFFAGPSMMLYEDEGLLAGMHIGSSGGYAVYSILYSIMSELGGSPHGIPTFTTAYP